MPPQSRAKAASAEQITITIDGTAYHLDLLGSSTVDRLELFRQSKLTLPQIVEALSNEQFETFFLAALVFLARRQMNQPATFLAIADAITWEPEIEIQFGEGDDDLPKEPETSTDDEPQS